MEQTKEKTRRLVVELTESTYKKLDELQDITGKWKKQIISELIDAELVRVNKPKRASA